MDKGTYLFAEVGMPFLFLHVVGSTPLPAPPLPSSTDAAHALASSTGTPFSISFAAAAFFNFCSFSKAASATAAPVTLVSVRNENSPVIYVHTCRRQFTYICVVIRVMDVSIG